MVNFLKPPLSGTAKRETSVATSVGAILFGSNILFISKLNFPVTILYPLDFVSS